MVQPGRKGYLAVEEGSSAMPQSLSISSRTGNTPSEYVASYEIEFTEGFESGSGDEFSAYITQSSGTTTSTASWTTGSSYRYGFNGKENDNEVKGEGNSLDFGARVYDPRLGRWLSVDPLQIKYLDASPYNFALNSPVQAIDPDGNLVIFINGQHLGHEGGKSSYWGGVDFKIMHQIGDFKAIYRDGSSGGFLNTLFNRLSHNNINYGSRIREGFIQGKKDAAVIIAGLKRDPNDPNKIVETVKVITHSMGTAYSRGYTAALEEYVTEYNTKHKEAPIAGFRIETQVDIAAFQGSHLPIKANVTNKLYMSGDRDDVANGKGSLRVISPSSNVPGSDRIETDPGTTHSITDYGKDFYIRQIPKSNNNPDPIINFPNNNPIDNTGKKSIVPLNINTLK